MYCSVIYSRLAKENDMINLQIFASYLRSAIYHIQLAGCNVLIKVCS